MNLYFLIVGLCVGALLSGVTIYCKARLGEVAGIILKIATMFVLLAFSMLQTSTKGTLSFYGGFTIALVNLSLVAITIGTLFLELKKIYPFHEKKYLYAGLLFLCTGALLSFVGLLLTDNSDINLFASTNLLIFVCLLVLSCVVGLCATFTFKKKFPQQVGQKGMPWIMGLLSSFAFACVALSLFVAIISTRLSLFVAFGAFVLLLAYEGFSVVQVFGEDKKHSGDNVVPVCLFGAMLAMQVFVYLI